MQHALNIPLCMAGDHCGGARKVGNLAPVCDMGREPQRHVNARVTKSGHTTHWATIAHSATQPLAARRRRTSAAL